MKEIEALTDAHAKAFSDRREQTDRLQADSEQMKEMNRTRHEENVAALRKEIETLSATLT